MSTKRYEELTTFDKTRGRSAGSVTVVKAWEGPVDGCRGHWKCRRPSAEVVLPLEAAAGVRGPGEGGFAFGSRWRLSVRVSEVDGDVVRREEIGRRKKGTMTTRVYCFDTM